MKPSVKKTTIQREQLNPVSQFREFLKKRGVNTATLPDEELKHIMMSYDIGGLTFEEMAKGIKEGERGWIVKTIEDGKKRWKRPIPLDKGSCCGVLEEGKSPYYTLSDVRAKYIMYLESLYSPTLLQHENGFSATLPGPEYVTDLFREARVKSTSKILEVGAAVGRIAVLAERFASNGETAFVQLDGTLLELSKEEIERWEAKVKVIMGKPNNLPVPDEKYDAVLFERSFVIVPEKEALLGELKRVLKPGGRLVLVDFVREREFPPDPEIEELMNRHVYACSVQSLTKHNYEELFEKTGLTTVKFILYRPVKTDAIPFPPFPEGTTPEERKVAETLKASGYQGGVIVAQKTKV